MSQNPIENYLTDIAEIQRTRSHTPETSFYSALETLLTSIGKELNPKVRCVMQISGKDSGFPDGGLFTGEQFRKRPKQVDRGDPLLSTQNPARGVIEVKAPEEDVRTTAESEQVGRYWKKYGAVLVTNLRSFALVGKDCNGDPRILETFTLADSAQDFWNLTAHPRKAAYEHGERMVEYLRRVLLHKAPLARPQDVATILASYAQDARLRMEGTDLPALASVRRALEDALGIRFEGKKGEHFFQSTLVQTLFYGVFSAWVVWARKRSSHESGGGSYSESLREETPHIPGRERTPPVLRKRAFRRRALSATHPTRKPVLHRTGGSRRSAVPRPERGNGAAGAHCGAAAARKGPGPPLNGPERLCA